MSLLQALPDDVHDGGPGVDDEIALPGLEQFRPVANLIEPLKGSQGLAGTKILYWQLIVK